MLDYAFHLKSGQRCSCESNDFSRIATVDALHIDKMWDNGKRSSHFCVPLSNSWWVAERGGNHRANGNRSSPRSLLAAKRKEATPARSAKETQEI